MNSKITKSIFGKPLRLLAVSLGMFFLTLGGGLALAMPAHALNITPNVNTKYQCGSGQNAVEVSINIGCYGASCQSSNPHGCSALLDGIFAIIRILSAGVGIVVVGSVVWAGIQYTTSRGDPAATSKAIERLRSTVIALLIFIFGYAILNFIIPAGFFK
jgi:hypothetical protein